MVNIMFTLMVKSVKPIINCQFKVLIFKTDAVVVLIDENRMIIVVDDLKVVKIGNIILITTIF